MFDFNEFLFYMLGTSNLTFLFAGALMAMFGWLCRIVILEIRKQPYNLIQLLLGLPLVAACMRFSAEVGGGELTMWLAFVYGLIGYDLANVFATLIDLFTTAMGGWKHRALELFNKLVKKKGG